MTKTETRTRPMIKAKARAKPRVGVQKVDVGKLLLLIEALGELSISVPSARFGRF